MLTIDLSKLLGPLADLVGTWKGEGGINVIFVPSRGSSTTSTGDAKTIARPYRETLIVSVVDDDGVLNRGGTLDQTVGAVKYTQEVYATDGKMELLHAGNGMWLYLGNIAKCNAYLSYNSLN